MANNPTGDAKIFVDANGYVVTLGGAVLSGGVSGGDSGGLPVVNFVNG